MAIFVCPSRPLSLHMSTKSALKMATEKSMLVSCPQSQTENKWSLMPNLFTKIQSKRIPSIFLPYDLVLFLPNKPAAKCSISSSFHFSTPYCSVLLTRLHSCFYQDLYDSHALPATTNLYTLLPSSG